MLNTFTRRILPAIIVLALIVLLLMPGVIGKSIQSLSIDTMLANIPEELDEVMDITQSEVESGWFRSQTRLTVNIRYREELTTDPMTLLLDLDIRHGPLFLTGNGIRLGWAYSDITPDIVGVDLSVLNELATVNTSESDLYMIAGFLQTLEFGGELGNISISDGVSTVQMSTSTGSLLIRADQSASASVTTGEISIANLSDGSFLNVSSTEFSSNRANIQDRASVGDAALWIPEISSNAPVAFSIQDILAEFRADYADTSGTRLDFEQLLTIRAMEWDYPVTTLTSEFFLSGISRSLIDQYLQLTEDMQQLAISDPTAVNARLSAATGEMLGLLVSDSFSLTYLFEVNAWDGDHLVDLRVNWAGLPGTTNISNVDPVIALEALELTLEVDADESALLLSPLGQMSEAYINQGVLVPENGRIRLTGRISDGQLNINDEILPLDQFF